MEEVFQRQCMPDFLSGELLQDHGSDKDYSKQFIIRKRQEKAEGISMRCVETWHQWRDEIAGKIKQ